MGENTCGNFWEIANKSNFEGESPLEFVGIFGNLKEIDNTWNSTWVCGDMEFLFMCSLMSAEHSKTERYQVEHKKKNSISPRSHASFCLLYKPLTNTKTPA